ncbi:hypothetical protein GQ457_09G022720 [Hibiscus cannabinus]
MKFTSLKLTTVKGVRDHINKMRDLAARLKALEVEMSDSFLVHYILNTLPPQYGPFKISYNTHKDKWSIDELLTMCDQEEGRLILEMGESALTVTQGKRPVQAKQRGKAKMQPQADIKKEFTCFFCKKKGHLKKDCVKYKVGLRRKGLKNLREPVGAERHIYSGNKMQSHVEAIGTCELVLSNCIKGKQTNKSKKGAKRSSTILEIIHSDICCPDMDVQGQKYFITFIEDYSRYMYLYMLHHKSEALEAFKVFKAEVEKQCESDYNVGAENDPESFSQAMSCNESKLWYDAMKDEMNSMKNNEVWDLVSLPGGVKAIGFKWVFKTKNDSKGNIERYKARLVAKGFTQREGINYTETFSPVSKKDSLRIVLALVAQFDLELQQMDVKTAFLNGDLEEEVYMKQPEGFSSSDGENLVCKLKKSIYGLKQASRQWGMLHEVKQFLSKNFDRKDMGDTSYVIGIKIYHDRHKGILGLSQETYINKVLERFRMKDCSPSVAPIVKGDKFNLNQCPKNEFEREQMKNIPYASVVGSLMYAQVCTRPDIAFAVGMLGRYQSNPGIDH